ALNTFWRKIVHSIHNHTYDVIFDPHIDDRSAALKQTQAQPKPPEQVHATTEITSSFTRLPKVLPDVEEDKPVMISEKTSTTVIEPCFFPHRRFYLASETPEWPEKNVVFLKEDPLLDSMRCFRNTLAKYVCAFLNSEDAAIYFGVSATGQVIGFYIDHKSEDTLVLDIDYVMKAIQPGVPISAYHVTFAKVINAQGHVEPNRVVLEVKVQGLMPVEYKYSYCGDSFIWMDNKLHKLNDFTSSGTQEPSTSGGCRHRGDSGQDSRSGPRQVNNASAWQAAVAAVKRALDKATVGTTKEVPDKVAEEDTLNKTRDVVVNMAITKVATDNPTEPAFTFIPCTMALIFGTQSYHGNV
ncbi:unnamed protein product, partial [Candidula unifasciata]